MKNSIKYTLISLLVIVPCVVAILVYNDKIVQDSPKYYSKGVELYNSGDYQNAYYVFGKIKWISPLYQMSLFKQAKAAQKIGDYNTAVLKYKLFLDKNDNSIFAKSARYNLAKCYYQLKKYEEAKSLFELIRAKAGNTSGAHDYFLGMINKNTDKELAVKYFMDYLQDDSIEDKSYEFAVAEELSDIEKSLGENERLLIGKIFYNNKKYGKSLEYFSKLPQEKCWDYLVLSNHYAGHKVVAKKLIENGIAKYSQSIDEENLHKIYDIYTSYMTGAKLKNWQFMLKLVQNNSLKGEDYVLYKLASISANDKATGYYSAIMTKYPASAYTPEAMWNVFWSEYSKKNYVKAKEIAYKHLKTYKEVNSTTRMAFWLAKILIKENKVQEAHNILSRLATKYPDDYYGLRADYIINKKGDFWQTDSDKRLPEQPQNIEFPITLSDLNIKDLKMINTLFEMGDYEVWLDADFKNKIVESWFELKKDKKSRSAVLARDAIKEMTVKPPYYSAAYKLAYPLYYMSELNVIAKTLDIDPYFLISIVKEESHFDENAKSSTNAVGLMQIMPATANYVVSKLNMEIPALADIANPKTNLFIGCNYLKYLEDRFHDDLLVTAAYNGGEGSVNKWLRAYGYDDKDEFVENVQFEETRNYIKKVFRTYHMYRKIYK